MPFGKCSTLQKGYTTLARFDKYVARIDKKEVLARLYSNDLHTTSALETFHEQLRSPSF